MLAFEDYEPLLSGRPIEQLARRILPEYPYRFPSLMGLLEPTRPQRSVG
jgi:hypothetical protein